MEVLFQNKTIMNLFTTKVIVCGMSIGRQGNVPKGNDKVGLTHMGIPP